MASGSGDAFDIGRVMTRTFGVIGRHPLPLLGLALLFSGLPELALHFGGSLDPRIAEWVDPDRADWIKPMLVLVFVYVFLSSLMQASLVVAILQDLDGGRIDARACVTTAIVLFFPLLGLSVLLALGLMTGFVLLIIPGVVFYVWWFVAVPVLVAERSGVLAAFGRSLALTDGARWPLLGLAVVFFILGVAIQVAAYFAGSLAFGDTGAAVLTAAGASVSSLITAAGTAATYVELRFVKDGTNTDGLADVFA